MPFYQYRKSHCGGKTVIRLSLQWIPCTCKTTSLYWNRTLKEERKDGWKEREEGCQMNFFFSLTSWVYFNIKAIFLDIENHNIHLNIQKNGNETILIVIGLSYCFLPVRFQTITWTNDDLFSNRYNGNPYTGNILRLSCICNGKSYTGKTVALYWNSLMVGVILGHLSHVLGIPVVWKDSLKYKIFLGPPVLERLSW